MQLIDKGHRVAVLAVDPSSSLSGGSILGDKTRMERLALEERAFIRPSPSRGVLGGVASHTREVMRLVEAAGYDVVIVETVGVGQSEVAVACMTDCFCLLQLPNSGDELQAIKRGVMELADLVVIHKADIDKAAATRAQVQIVSSLRLHGQAHGQGWMPEVCWPAARPARGRRGLGRRCPAIKRPPTATCAASSKIWPGCTSAFKRACAWPSSSTAAWRHVYPRWNRRCAPVPLPPAPQHGSC